MAIEGLTIIGETINDSVPSTKIGDASGPAGAGPLSGVAPHPVSTHPTATQMKRLRAPLICRPTRIGGSG